MPNMSLKKNEMPAQAPDVRNKNFKEVALGYTAETAVDEAKRIITRVSYTESTDEVNLDSKLVLKVATGTKGNLSAISREDLIPINAYINKMKFAGTRLEVISAKGDVLIPRLTVYYDGAVPEAAMYDAIEERLNSYMMDIDFAVDLKLAGQSFSMQLV